MMYNIYNIGVTFFYVFFFYVSSSGEFYIVASKNIVEQFCDANTLKLLSQYKHLFQNNFINACSVNYQYLHFNIYSFKQFTFNLQL